MALADEKYKITQTTFGFPFITNLILVCLGSKFDVEKSTTYCSCFQTARSEFESRPGRGGPPHSAVCGAPDRTVILYVYCITRPRWRAVKKLYKNIVLTTEL